MVRETGAGLGVTRSELCDYNVSVMSPSVIIATNQLAASQHCHKPQSTHHRSYIYFDKVFSLMNILIKSLYWWGG